MRWILVTGSAQHLGRAIALALAKKGYSIVCHTRKSQKEAKSLAQECQEMGVEAEIIQADFSSPDEVKVFIDELLRRFPKLFGLVNNVGNYLIKPVLETSEEEWRALFQTNCYTPIALMRALFPTLQKEQGRVVNIGTVGVDHHLVSHTATAYFASKLALYSATLAFAKEGAAHGITVNMVSPGFLETAVDLKDIEAIPMKRAARCEEVAEVVVSLFDERSSYITGQDIEVAGGVKL